MPVSVGALGSHHQGYLSGHAFLILIPRATSPIPLLSARLCRRSACLGAVGLAVGDGCETDLIDQAMSLSDQAMGPSDQVVTVNGRVIHLSDQAKTNVGEVEVLLTQPWPMA